MANLSQQINTLQEQVINKIQTISTRAQTINRDIGVVNQNVQRAFEELAGFQQRITAIVERIKQLKGRGSEALKREFLGKLTDINRELDTALANLSEDLTGPINQMPQAVGRQVDGIQAGLQAIEQELTSAEQGGEGPGGPPDGGPGGGGGGGGAQQPLQRGPGGINLQGDIGKDGDHNPFALSREGKAAFASEIALQRAARETARRGGKKNGNTKRNVKGKKHKGRKTRRGGYVIPKKRAHSANRSANRKNRKTPGAGKKTKSKK